MTRLGFRYTDGGRWGRGQNKGDCVTRAISLATGRSYDEVYSELLRRMVWHRDNRRDALARVYQKRMKAMDPSNGVNSSIYRWLIEEKYGWIRVPLMAIGSGCRWHLNAHDMPTNKRFIARLSKHLCYVENGFILDTYDPSRGGTRCVYAIWRPPHADW